MSEFVGKSHWQISIDVGGTFTDCIATSPEGRRLVVKVLSSGITKGRIDSVDRSQHQIVDRRRIGESDQFWEGYQIRLIDSQGNVVGESYVARFSSKKGCLQLADFETAGSSAVGYELYSTEPAPLLAIRTAIGLKLEQAIPSSNVRLGTTRGTNALLTRSGAVTGFLTTRGFGDLLHIGNQSRPRLFELAIRKHEPLATIFAEVDERIAHDGVVLRRLDENQARGQMEELKNQGVESLAICLLHADRYPVHEAALKKIAAEVGFRHLSVSHEVSPTIGFLRRAQTTVLDAYLNPVLRDYVDRIEQILGKESRLRLMTSSGGLIAGASFSGKDSLLSGPAGGVVGFARTAEQAGFDSAVGFDMGGTSTDVSRYDGEFELEYESEKAGVFVAHPQMAIETVAAGGGSICRYDGAKLVVGPQSATSDPGPACYGRGGPLAITDVNLFLGRIRAERFPWRLDREAVVQRLQEVADEIRSANGTEMTLTELAEGFLRIANLSMANAIRAISIERGYDVREDVLCGFGGAAPQHVCAVADELGIRRILLHPDAGVLSALGIGLADVTRHAVSGIYQDITHVERQLIRDRYIELESSLAEQLFVEGISASQVGFIRRVELRYQGTSATITLALDDDEYDPSLLAARFAEEHRRRYSYVQDKSVELVVLRVEAVSESALSDVTLRTKPKNIEPSHQEVQLVTGGRTVDARCVEFAQLLPGDSVQGPALVFQSSATIVVDEQWVATMLDSFQLLIEKQDAPRSSNSERKIEDRKTSRGISLGLVEEEDETQGLSSPSKADPTLLEVFNHHFQSIATEMGEVLRRTAASINVKERLDYSCALFSPKGDLVVNAPHIPVHLGAMSDAVRSAINDFSDLADGDVIVTNDPFRGGSHLPDITVITPIFDENRPGTLLCLVASRAHHAEIGGRTPGSMPPDSTRLGEEGVLISNFRLMHRGETRFDRLRDLLCSGEFPSRDPDENLADMSAQIAANRLGQTRFLELARRYSSELVTAYMDHIQDAAELLIREAIRATPDRVVEFTDHMDDGAVIRVKAEKLGDQLRVDFAGTAAVHPGNLNANRSIVTAALLYCLRCFVDCDVPLNEGLLAPVSMYLPVGMLNPPARSQVGDSPAMVGGNVETSQRVVDVLLAAFGLAAASQGTMNNLLFGDATFGYYETICGGAGATAALAGADAVQTHMTNTRMTDPEIFEARFPVRLWQFAIRKNSGGCGKQRGGHGVVREIEFLKRLQLSLLTQRRGTYPPFGMAGGKAGSVGRNSLQPKAGKRRPLGAREVVWVEAGDRLIIETPGGGGWGSPQQHD